MKEPTLVILAAGMGSRFGGLKQITAVDGHGHAIIDFSLYDAWRAGFRKVAFIIKHEIEEDFKAAVGRRMEKYFEVKYVFQQLDKLPAGYTVPEGRVKPWGTGHATLCAKDAVDGPFAVINADDFYGPSAYAALYEFLTAPGSENEHALVGYQLRKTVTENGTVARGICQVDDEGYLTEIIETHNIVKKDKDFAVTEDTGKEIPMSSLASMNMWGVTPDYLDILETGFVDFLKNIPEGDIKAEYLLPIIMEGLLKDGRAKISVLETHDKWFGITYAADKEKVIAEFKKLVDKGVYPTPLNS